MSNIFNKKINFFGFTIVESLVAIGVISFAVIGPLSAARKGLSATSDSRDNSRLIFLAEEGLEFIRMVIDQNVYNGVDWLTDLDDCLGNLNFCGVSTLNYSSTFPRTSGGSSVVDCDFNNDCQMKTGTGLTQRGFYTYSSSASFNLNPDIKRKINILEKVDNKEVEVSVTISARMGGKSVPRVFTSKVRIFNWKHQPYSI